RSPRYRLEVLPPDAWAGHVADRLVERLTARPTLRICLPTGDTPTPLYDALVGRGAPFGGAEVLLLDEYLGLSEDDPARAGERLRRELIDRLADPPAAYHPIDLAGPPDQAAGRHDVLAAAGLDLTLVGIGRNGHVGFNEPGSDADSETRVVALAAESRQVAEAYGASEGPRSGITLGLRRLLESAEIWLLATGRSKAEILARALEGPETPQVPASFLRRHHRLTVLADEAAATRLTGRPSS
ncbi:MAG TPA: glucosamine-6-phosphate deaminase, partial [Candidatus Limnocylindria bacterium]|nr:glucosamine-6-phosphate deaminase [Candidatus Limnocylindria bacterium]